MVAFLFDSVFLAPRTCKKYSQNPQLNQLEFEETAANFGFKNFLYQPIIAYKNVLFVLHRNLSVV